MQFVYEREFWFANAGINSSEIDVDEYIQDLNQKLITKLNNLEPSDLPEIDWDKEIQKEVIQLGKEINETIIVARIIKSSSNIETSHNTIF